MRKNIYLSAILFYFLFCFCTAQAGAELSVKAEVDKLKLSTDEILTYKIIITSSEKTAPKLELPKFEGFLVVSQAQSSTFSFRADKMGTQFVYVYLLSPQQAGKLQIPPTTVKINAELYPTNAFEIEVTVGKLKPGTRQAPGGVQPGKPNFDSGEPKYTL